MPTMTPVYGSPVTMTITLTSLTQDANMLVGRTSDAVDQKDTDDAIDCLVGGKSKSASAGPFQVWAYGSYDDTEFADGITGTDAGYTPTNKSALRHLTTIIPSGASAFKWGPCSVAQAFGGVLPVRWGVFIVHGSFSNLSATASDHAVIYIPVKWESA